MVGNGWLPGAPEVEKHVLGAILLDADDAAVALERLKPLDFCWKGHALIFETMQELFLSGGSVNLLSLAQRMARTERLEQAGGEDYLRTITAEVVTGAHVESYTNLIKDASLRRRLIVGSANLLELAQDQRKENSAVMGEAESLIFGLADDRFAQGLTRISAIYPEALQDLATAASGQVTGIATGLTDLDAMTGGLQRTDFSIWAARPGMGKTALALTASWRAAKRGAKVAFFSMEMGRRQLVQRALCAPYNVNIHNLRRGRLEPHQIANFKKAYDELQNIPLFIDDAPRKTPIQIFSQARRMKRTQGLDLLILDYIQLGRLDKPPETRAQELTQYAYAMKEIAKELDIHVLALAQLNREVEHRTSHVPQLSDLKESGGLEEAADIVGGLYRPEMYDKVKGEHGLAELHWLKFRNGPAGDATAFTFNHESASFSDYVQPSLLEGTQYAPNSSKSTAGTHRAGGSPPQPHPHDPGPQLEPWRGRPPRPGEAGYD